MTQRGNESLFIKELYPMLYAFGDAKQPRPDTVQLVEQLVTNYLTRYLEKAKRVSPMGKLRTEDLLFCLRDDPKKLARVEELLFMNEELKKARKTFDMEEEDFGKQ